MRTIGVGIFSFGALLAATTCATAAGFKFQVTYTGHVDCYRPFAISGIPLSGSGSATLDTSGNGSVDLVQRAFALSSTLHFSGRLGKVTPAPGGTTQTRVIGKNQLLVIWNLPNNQITIDIHTSGSSCSATFGGSLRPGKTEYTLFDGNIYHYCGRPIADNTTCEMQLAQ